MKITIVGLGPGSPENLTLGALNALKRSKNIFLRTEKHPITAFLREQKIAFETFDYIYEKSRDFNEVYGSIAEALLELIKSKQELVYAVPGNPFVAEKSVELLINRAKEKNIDVEVIEGLSFLDILLSKLGLDGTEGVKLVDGLKIEEFKPDFRAINVILQVYDAFVASSIKLKLMEYYDDETEIFVMRGLGIPELEKIVKIPLYELDRLSFIDHLTTVVVPKLDLFERNRYDFYDLADIMDYLRSDKGCPWDREQTHKSLMEYLLEEAYEVVDAIKEEDEVKLCEELGDLLLQVVFHSCIAEEEGFFNSTDVTTGIVKKLIFRHPHVFGKTKLKTAEDVVFNWEKIKKREKGLENHTEVLMDIPKNMPALMRSYKVQDKAARVGFDWDNVEDAMKKIDEELQEFKEAFALNDKEKMGSELGDLIFAIVNVARFLKINPELALMRTVDKFIKRFGYIEKEALKQGKKLEEMSLNEMDALWNQSKRYIF